MLLEMTQWGENLKLKSNITDKIKENTIYLYVRRMEVAFINYIIAKWPLGRLGTCFFF